MRTLICKIIIKIIQNLHRMSLIGHSLGGLILRAAIPFLQDFEEKFHTFLTFSSPHLGFMYHSSKMIDFGIKLLILILFVCFF